MTDNNSMALSPFRADLSRALARRGERLLAATDLAEEVAILAPLEAYYIIKESGVSQALPILHHLSQEQLEACIDLDCWNRYDFAVDRLDEWLAAFALSGPEAMAKAFFTLDYVVQLLFLCQTVTVYDPDTDQIPLEDEGIETIRAMTPDGFYLLELKSELALKLHPFTVLDSLYQYDLTATHQLLSEVRVDLPTQIEEEALRFRSGRMQDLGFAPPEEAAVLFTRPGTRPSMARPNKPFETGVAQLPSAYAAPLIENTLLQHALTLITDRESLARLEQEIVYTINSAIIAYGEKTQDIDQITDIAERVRDTISLGLESLVAKEDADSLLDVTIAAAKSSDLLEAWSITDLFRHGVAATLALQQEMRQALTDARFRAWYDLPESRQSDEPGERLERAFVTALLGRHPMRSGFDQANPEKLKAFACLADIDVARLRLKRLIARICDHE